MLLILMVKEMMMLVMTMTMSMGTMMLDGPIYENVVPSLYMAAPKLRFCRNPDQLLLP